MALVLLATINQSGTNYVMARRNCIQIHCGSRELDTDAALALPWITTYRDPHLVAASWINRRPLSEVRRLWYDQWESYHDQVLPRAQEILRVAAFDGPVMKSSRDVTGAKAAFEAGDMDRYYEIVPRELVEFALEMSAEARLQ